MTRDQALKKAAVRFDVLSEDSIRRLLTCMITAGRDDDEVSEVVALAIDNAIRIGRSFCVTAPPTSMRLCGLVIGTAGDALTRLLLLDQFAGSLTTE